MRGTGSPRSVRVATAAVTLTVLALLAGLVPAAGAEPGITLRRVLSGYSRPVLVTHDGRPGRDIFIVEQSGLIKRATFRDGAWRKLGTFLDLRSRVGSAGGERGLLGLAFHPQYASNGRFYVSYTRAGDGDSVIAEYRRASTGRADPSSRRVVLVVPQPYSNHNGGHIAFGPDDLLYIGLGDGGSGGDPHGNGQKRSTLLGKILRIDPVDPDGSGPKRYRVPAGNPFVDRKGRDEIWSLGLRNPWRFSFDRSGGDLWIGDVGQKRREEVDRARADGSGLNAGRGLNFGWNDCEGRREYGDSEGDDDNLCEQHTRPVHDYAHGSGRCSVSGGYVHRGPRSPAWHGRYVAGDYCGRLFVLSSQGRVLLSKVTARNISSFGEDRAGRIFLVDHGGSIYLVGFTGSPPGS